MESETAIFALSALAQGTRLDVFRLLVRHEPNGLAAGELARKAGAPQNTMSAHLGVLSRAGLVTAERQGRSIIYRANLAALQKLTRFLVEDCCGGSVELCMPSTGCKPTRGANAARFRSRTRSDHETVTRSRRG